MKPLWTGLKPVEPERTCEIERRLTEAVDTRERQGVDGLDGGVERFRSLAMEPVLHNPLRGRRGKEGVGKRCF